MGTLEQTVFGKSIQSSSVTHVSGKCRFGTSQLTPNVAEDCSVVSPKYLMSLARRMAHFGRLFDVAYE